jgi:hypothetical protein
MLTIRVVRDAPTVGIACAATIPVALDLEGVLGLDEAALEAGGLGGEESEESAHGCLLSRGQLHCDGLVTPIVETTTFGGGVPVA